MLSGVAGNIVVGEKEFGRVEGPWEIEIPRGHYHRFELQQGAVLLGVTTAVFDPDDEIKGKPDRV